MQREIEYLKDNYKVEIISEKNNKKYIIDISLRAEQYLKEIYYENGKLRIQLFSGHKG